MIAALFVDPKGPYPALGLDCWDEKRDARLFTGPVPVIAHPPCARWSQLGRQHAAMGGLPVGADGRCFEAALAALRRCGGVLEHPRNTAAWPAFGLVRPPREGWGFSGDLWVCEVWQSAYGHQMSKATWLAYAGARPPFDLRWNRPRGTHCMGGRGDRPEIQRNLRHITPIAFALELVRLAEWSQG